MKKDEKVDQPRTAGSRASTGSQTLVTYQVGALPILNRILKRMKLEDFLHEAIEEDPRCEVSPVKALSLLVRNFICSREPIYGVGEWAGRQRPISSASNRGTSRTSTTTALADASSPSSTPTSRLWSSGWSDT